MDWAGVVKVGRNIWCQKVLGVGWFGVRGGFFWGFGVWVLGLGTKGGRRWSVAYPQNRRMVYASEREPNGGRQALTSLRPVLTAMQASR